MPSTATVWIAAALLLFASMYFGTGWSLVAFSFPGAVEHTTPASFPERFGAPVKRAVLLFTTQTILMIIGSTIMIVTEWDHGAYRWAPVAYLVGTCVSGAFTTIVIFPVNKRLSAEVDDVGEFRGLLSKWIRYTVIRTVLWTIEWVAITAWFVARVLDT